MPERRRRVVNEAPTRVYRAYRRDSFFARKRHEEDSSGSTRRMAPPTGIRPVRDPAPVKRPKLDERLVRLELALQDLSSAWIDALDEWQHAQRSDADAAGAMVQRMRELEQRMRELALKQQQVGRAFEAAIENAG